MHWEATERGVEVTNAGVTVVFGIDDLERFEKEINELQREVRKRQKQQKYATGNIWTIRATKEDVVSIGLTDSATRMAWKTADGRIWSAELAEFERLFRPKTERG